MQLLPIKTRRIEQGDDLVEVLNEGMKELGVRNPAFVRLRRTTADREELDILVISSKAVTTAEGRIVDLSLLKVSKEAEKLAEKCGRSPAFCEAVLEETKRRNGSVRGTCPGAIVTELRPDGLPSGVIITANAGLDESNTKQGTAVGWPEDPVNSVRKLRHTLENQIRTKDLGLRTKESLSPLSLSPSPSLAVIISDSCVHLRRSGVTAFALAVSGIDPLRDEAGREDLFGRKLRITKEAIADQLATAANMLMGNAEQSIPAVIIRDHGFTLSDYEGWVPGIEPKEDFFQGIV